MLSYIEYYIYMRVFTFFSIIVVCCSEYLLVGHLSNLVGRLPMSDSSLQHKIQKISAAGVLPELNKLWLRLRQIGQNSGSGTPAPVHSTKAADGEDLGAEDQIAPQNLFLQSLFSQVNVSLNDKLLTPSATTYPYRAMIETLLNFGPAAKQSQMTSGLYYKDTPGKMDVVNPLAADANANMGLKKRRSFIATSSRSCDMSGPIHADICFQERLIIPGVDIKVKLVRSPNNFCLLAGGENPAYKVIIQAAVLRVRRVTVSPTLCIEHEKFLDKTTAKYPISRVEVKSMAIPQGLLSLDRENVFLGVLPKRVVIALVHNEAYHGSYAKNAFNFHHYKVTQVALSVNGETRKPIQVQFGDAGVGLYIRGYETLVWIKCLPTLEILSVVKITPKDMHCML